MTWDALLGRMQEVLTEKTGSELAPFSFTETGECRVDVRGTELEYGLARVSLSIPEDRYQYVPAIVLKGTVTETSPIEMTEPTSALLRLNALDGTILP